MSEKAGEDIGLVDATQNYIETVLAVLPEERTLLSSDDEIELI